MSFAFDQVIRGTLPQPYRGEPTYALLRDLLADLVGHDLPETLPSRAQWCTAARAAPAWVDPEGCLTVLESWLLARVVQDKDLKADATSRAARLWCDLAPPTPWNGPSFIDPNYRWHHLPRQGSAALTEADAAALIHAVEARCGARYTLPFPAVELHSRTCALIACRANLLALVPGDDSSGSARILLAPWSEFLVPGETIKKLNDTFPTYRDTQEAPLFKTDERFLLEFFALDGAKVPTNPIVEGDSLDLSILIAALAARTKPALLAVVATGAIGAKSGKIVSVGEIPAKWRSVEAYARERHENVLFLGPTGTRKLVAAPDIHEWVRTEELGSVSDLPGFIENRLSTGCDKQRDMFIARGAIVDYRNDVEAPPDRRDMFEQGDVEALTEFAVTALEAPLLGAAGSPPLPVHILPFGNDPRLAARHVARVVLDRVESANSSVIPLLFPLYARHEATTEGRVSAIERLVYHLRQGAFDAQVWPPHALDRVPDDPDLIRKESLRNLLVRFDERLLLVIYDRSSLKVDDDGQRVAGLLETLRERAPRARAVVIASDRHHRVWLGTIGVVEPREEVPVG